VRTWVTGVCCFPVAADIRGERLAGSGTGPFGPAAGAAPQASLRRLAASPMIGRREAEPVLILAIEFAFGSVPMSWLSLVRAVPLAAFIPSRARPGLGEG